MIWPLLAAAGLAVLFPALLRAQPEPQPWNPLAGREEQICGAFGFPPSHPRWSDCRVVARRHANDLPGATADLQVIANYCVITRRGILTHGFPDCLLAWDERRAFCDRQPPGLSAEVLAMRQRYCGILGHGVQ